MKSNTYTNLILTVIAVLLASLLFKSFSGLPLENKVLAGDENYKEFRTVQTANYALDKILQENIKSGWKPISIAQSQPENQSNRDITVLLGK